MFVRLRKLETELRDLVSALDPEGVGGAEAVRLVEGFAALERLACAGKALAARRVAASGAWRGQGDRSAAHWMARTTGVSLGQAIGVVETAERLTGLAATDQAVRSGRLSAVQASEIASAAAQDPDSESALLGVAASEGVAGLRTACRRVIAAAASDELGRYEQVRQTRHLRHWSDPDGAFRLDVRTTPDEGAVFLAGLEAYKEQIFQAARKEGRREPYEAYAADALVAMAAHRCHGEAPPSGPKAMVQVRVDHTALLRGHTVAGETCEIPGVGPIPVASAQAWMGDAIVSAVVNDGVDVRTVAHLGRTIPAHLRTALQARDPRCVVVGCEVHQRLEIDHIVPVAKGGPTRLDNLCRLCRWHHYLKTHRGYQLEGGPARWRLIPPNPPPDVPEPDDQPKTTLKQLSLALAHAVRITKGLPP